ncbi:hypothetical protein ACSRUE_30850 [Sorangium sp. KYC3313]|uniref:hypothetical protein n=1 Tax=Sorangium sp. KYC3313 TaxID=3449740 RepID=UPI003F8928A9
MRDLKGIVEVELLVEEGGALTPTREYVHRETTYVEGRSGQRYALRVRNPTGARVEVVPTVDGLDVQSGKDASTRFTRATPKPAAVLVIRYEQRDGLRALGIDVDGLHQRETASPFPAETGFAKPPPGWKG